MDFLPGPYQCSADKRLSVNHTNECMYVCMCVSPG